MKSRVILVFVAMGVLAGPVIAAAQERSPVTVQGAAGGLVNVPGNSQAVSVGFWPGERVGFLVGVERIHMPTEIEEFPGGVSATRGGTTTFVSGEIRVLPLGFNRVTPYAVAGAGAGIARPNVNDLFPDPAEHNAMLLFGGGGVHIPVGDRVSVFGDVRFVLQVERSTDAGVFLFVPVRAGLGWRF